LTGRLPIASAIALLLIGCSAGTNAVCVRDGVATTCDVGAVCSSAGACVSPAQLQACAAIADGAACSFGATPGFCADGACVTTLDQCGDGVLALALGERCDCGTSALRAEPTAGCAGYNSNAPGASCRTDCTLARCGDGVVDPGEVCDDGNTLPGDGCAPDCRSQFAVMNVPTAANLMSAWALGTADVYVGGGGTLIHYDGIGWTSHSVPSGFLPTSEVATIWGDGANDLWIAGYFAASGAVARFDGSQWTAQAIPPTSVGALWGRGPDDLYVSGNGFTGTYLGHFDGASWTQIMLPAGCSNFISPLAGDATHVFVAGSSICVGTSSTQWTVFDAFPASSLLAANGHLYAVDAAAFIDYDLTGNTKTIYASPGVTRLTPAGSDHIIAVGGVGVAVFTISTGKWEFPVLPPNSGMYAAAANSTTDVFIVGEAGIILH